MKRKHNNLAFNLAQFRLRVLKLIMILRRMSPEPVLLQSDEAEVVE